VNRYIRYKYQDIHEQNPKLSHTRAFIYSIPRQRQSKRIVKSRKDHKSHKPGKSYLPPRPKIDHSSSKRNTLPPAPLPNQLHIPTPVNLLTSTFTQRHTRQCPRVRGNSPVHLLRGIDRVGLPSRVGVFFEGGLRRRGW
jgi:hypothetical protein